MANAVTVEQVDMWEVLCDWSEQVADGKSSFGSIIPVMGPGADYLWLTYFTDCHKLIPNVQDRFMYLCFLHEMQLTGDL
jgi:hypothetical protein